MAYEKINSKKYSIRLNDELVDIDVPFGKSRALFEAFVGSGGMIGEDGEVKTDIMSLVANFGTVGDILLSNYGPKGEVVKEGDCRELATEDVIELFKMATEIVEAFIKAFSEAKTPQPEKAPKEKAGTKKTIPA